MESLRPSNTPCSMWYDITRIEIKRFGLYLQLDSSFFIWKQCGKSIFISPFHPDVSDKGLTFVVHLSWNGPKWTNKLLRKRHEETSRKNITRKHYDETSRKNIIRKRCEDPLKCYWRGNDLPPMGERSFFGMTGMPSICGESPQGA